MGRLVAADQNVTLIQQKPVIQKQGITTNPVIAASVPAPVNTSPHSKTSDNKTCRWKFENGQICGKVFTKTYNLTVHMRMYQDTRPLPCRDMKLRMELTAQRVGREGKRAC